ncbi:hypothetical protein WCT56_23215 [Pectobacterium parmentieri]|uniref:hypothetical protein n=1 Tax=Pectobacterium parmentieri TaxID=1905730 RepID=UPI000F8E744E|nr:hypothetical protein [Pectobacterium parmentieri]AZS56806.1 hypothetical protein C5E18_12050 [Pectobacterium parmentieri]
MKKALIVSLIFLSTPNYVGARDLSPEEIQAVESTVRDEMKDPDAAKFYHGDFPEPEKTYVYCGLVNGKNSYGAYTGKKLFSVFLLKNDKGEYKALSLNHNKSTREPLSQELISATCASSGYDIKVKKYLVKNINESRKKSGLPPIDKGLIEK